MILPKYVKVWIEEVKRWSPVFNLLYDSTTLVTILNEITHGKIVMVQWIGMKDKNNQHIFEGDILYSCTTKQGMRILHTVGYQNGRFGLIGRRGTVSIQNISFWKSVEVIGNVKSNPELVEEAKYIK